VLLLENPSDLPILLAGEFLGALMFAAAANVAFDLTFYLNLAFSFCAIKVLRRTFASVV
jgi:hypothetical protein